MSKKHRLYSRELSPGVWILGEEIPHLSSAAFTVLIASGAASDSPELQGSSTILSEMLQKGAGELDSRALSEQFERFGAHRSHTSGIEVSTISSSQLSEHLNHSLSLYGQVLLEPWLPQTELPAVQALALQDLEALEDEPASKVMSELARHFYPNPFNRSQFGTAEGIQAVSEETLRAFYSNVYRKSELLIGVAGAFDWEEVCETAAEAFGHWQVERERISVGPLPSSSAVHHEQRDTKQVQIALAYPSVGLGDPQYYAAKVAVAILSGGMSGRLFVEVREKRGLVYRVSASHSAARGRSAVFASAGTTPENAEETLSVMLKELRGVAEGLEEEELQRAKADLKSKVILRSESSSVRSAALVNDWWNLGRMRELEELRAGIESVTIEDVRALMSACPLDPLTLMTLGPRKLELPS